MTLHFGSYDIAIPWPLIVAILLPVVALGAHAIRCALGLHPSPAPQGTPHQDIPRWLVTLRERRTETLERLFNQNTEQSYLFFFLALFIMILDGSLHYAGMRILFPGLRLLDILGAVGFVLALGAAAALAFEQTAHWTYKAWFYGLLLIVTWIGANASYYIAKSQGYSLVMVIVATCLGGLIRLVISAVAALVLARPFENLLGPVALLGVIETVAILHAAFSLLMTIFRAVPRILIAIFFGFADLGAGILSAILWVASTGKRRPRVHILQPLTGTVIERRVVLEGMATVSGRDAVQVYGCVGRRRYYLGRVPVSNETFRQEIDLDACETFPARARKLKLFAQAGYHKSRSVRLHCAPALAVPTTNAVPPPPTRFARIMARLVALLRFPPHFGALLSVCIILLCCSGCGDPPPSVRGPVALYLILDRSHSWWDAKDGTGEVSASAKQWLHDHALPYLQPGDRVICLGIGPHGGTDKEVLQTTVLPGDTAYDPRFLDQRDKLGTFLDNIPPTDEEGSGIWQVADHAADLASSDQFQASNRIVVFLTDFIVDSPRQGPPLIDHPTSSFPGSGTHVFCLFVPRNGRDSATWTRFKEEVSDKFKNMGIAAPSELLEPAESANFDLQQALPREGSSL